MVAKVANWGAKEKIFKKGAKGESMVDENSLESRNNFLTSYKTVRKGHPSRLWMLHEKELFVILGQG